MSAPNRTDDTAAAAGFVTFLALAGGVVGLLIAAVAVATERAWSGRRSTAPARDRLRSARTADHRAWLARDAAEQAAWRQARRDWWASGADPASAPATPGVWRRAGTAMRRVWARTAVRASDFRDGWREGWQAADQVRRDGGRFRDVARTRPHRPEPQVPPVPQSSKDNETHGRLGDIPDDRDDGTQSCTDDEQTPTTQDNTDSKPTDTDSPTTSTEDTDMGAKTNTPTSSTPQADTNAAVMAAQLGAINASNQQISDLTDQLAKLRAEQEARVRTANEFAESTGQTAQTKTALDAATAVNVQLGQHLGAFSDAAEVAAEETNAARDGLTPVIHAEDTLTQAGADGRAVAAATNA